MVRLAENLDFGNVQTALPVQPKANEARPANLVQFHDIGASVILAEDLFIGFGEHDPPARAIQRGKDTEIFQSVREIATIEDHDPMHQRYGAKIRLPPGVMFAPRMASPVNRCIAVIRANGVFGWNGAA
jgi:hypothetical protein